MRDCDVYHGSVAATDASYSLRMPMPRYGKQFDEQSSGDEHNMLRCLCFFFLLFFLPVDCASALKSTSNSQIFGQTHQIYIRLVKKFWAQNRSMQIIGPGLFSGVWEVGVDMNRKREISIPWLEINWTTPKCPKPLHKVHTHGECELLEIVPISNVCEFRTDRTQQTDIHFPLFGVTISFDQ